ncbi:uncharacterized protein LOC143892391 isoform X2 [Tasmannia lanceolata]|uniref:uncharacterized protein LOC143892391 isoform X2 n=1 Tax=Tasmannia lanceolata TaxID=3420 RepID=UPI0040632580
MMPKPLAGSDAHNKHNELGPNYFGYYKHEFLELFSQKEDFLSPFCGQNPETSAITVAKGKFEDINRNTFKNREANICASASLFNGGIGEGLSDCKRERLKAFLKRSVVDLNQEVDEIIDQVLAVHQLQKPPCHKEISSCHSSALDEDMNRHLPKKQKISSSPISNYIHAESICFKVDENSQALLENGELQSEECRKKYSDELFAKLGNMEQHLEDFLDVIVSKCRPMTYLEKQKLQLRIQKLPAKSLDRVVEIIQHRNSSADGPPDEIHVDLDQEDDVVLWRLHYYVESVESANKLSS